MKNTFNIINLTVKINYKYLYILKRSCRWRWRGRGRKISWRLVRGRIIIGQICHNLLAWLPTLFFILCLHFGL
jgi:hypothetical protein